MAPITNVNDPWAWTEYSRGRFWKSAPPQGGGAALKMGYLRICWNHGSDHSPNLHLQNQRSAIVSWYASIIGCCWNDGTQELPSPSAYCILDWISESMAKMQSSSYIWWWKYYHKWVLVCLKKMRNHFIESTHVKLTRCIKWPYQTDNYYFYSS